MRKGKIQIKNRTEGEAGERDEGKKDSKKKGERKRRDCGVDDPHVYSCNGKGSHLARRSLCPQGLVNAGQQTPPESRINC